MTLKLAGLISCFLATISFYTACLDPTEGAWCVGANPTPGGLFRKMTYDEVSGTLELTFQDGRTCTYRDVPLKSFVGLEASGSNGYYYNRHIRGQFPRR